MLVGNCKNLNDVCFDYSIIIELNLISDCNQVLFVLFSLFNDKLNIN